MEVIHCTVEKIRQGLECLRDGFHSEEIIFKK